MMKKSFSLLLVLTLILSSFGLVASAATGANQVISDFNIMPQSCAADSDDFVTRKDFAFTIANILGGGDAEPRATDFVDVTVEDENSGYIYYATVNGFLVPTGNMFCPNDPISLHDFNEVVVKLLAYETIAQANGGGIDGAMKTVRDLKIYDGVTIVNYDTVTVKQYRQLVYNLMTANVSNFSYSYDQNGNVDLYRTGTTKTVLSQYFGISRYYGSIIEVNNDKPSVKFNVTKNASESNPVYLTVGANYDFLSNGKVDLNFYQNIPVELWTNKDGLIVYIAPQANVEVFYDVIYSVNDDTDSTMPYTLSMVSEIELNRDTKEYKIAPDVQLRFNGNIVNKAPLAGHYAKIVLINNKVTFIETWELSEGGLITEVNNSYISFIKGGANTRLKGISDYSNIMVIIDGRSTDRDQIKPGSLFSYFMNEDQLVIVASEKTIVGELESFGANELEIGRNFYPVKSNVYVSEDGVEYVENDFDRVFGVQILCYVDIFGDICYIKADGRLNPDNTFTGYVLGYSQKAFQDTKVRIQKIHPVVEEVEITIPVGFNKYETRGAVHGTADVVKSKFNFSNPDNAVMTANDVITAYKKFFKFKVDENNVATLISEADYYRFFGDAHTITRQWFDENGEFTDQVTTANITSGFAFGIKTSGFDGSTPRTYFSNADLSDGLISNVGTGSSQMGEFRIYNDRFVCIYLDPNEKVVCEEVPYDSLKGLGTYNSTDGTGVNDDNMKWAMFGSEKSSLPEFTLLYGNMNGTIGYNQWNKSAYIEDITKIYDPETDSVYYELTLENKDFKWKLNSLRVVGKDNVSSITNAADDVTDLAVGMKVSYHDGAMFNPNGIYMTGVTAPIASTGSGSMSVYEFLAREGWTTCIEGQLEKLDDYRLYVSYEDQPGVAPSYLRAYGSTVQGLKVMEDGTLKAIEKSEADVPYGATVYFGSTYRVGDIYYILEE